MAAKNKDYWKKRMEALEDENYRRSMAYYKDVQEQFRQASNSMQMDIERWYRRLAENNDISYASAKKFLKSSELEEFKWSVEQYIKAGRENAVDQRWMKELENASARFHISYLEAMKLQAQQHAELLSAEFEGGMTDFLHKSYEEQFYRTAFEVSKGVGTGFNLARLDDRRIDMLLKRPWAQDGRTFSDRIWSNKEKLVTNLHTELSQCIIRGESPRSAIARLVKKMDVSRAQAGNVIMTESAAISSAAQQECYKNLGVEQYQFDATLDGITCEVCQGMDQKVFKMSEYEVGVTANPIHPRCRCCTTPYFDDWEEFGISPERAARDPETGKTVYVPADIKYGEWEKKFVVEKEREPDIIKSGAVSGALNDKNDPLGLRREKHAETFYQAIRNSKKDSFVKTISENTGISESSISKIYDHVFLNEYELYGGRRRFDPDYDMAESFRRLREGKNIQQHDLILLRHERLECELMRKTGRGYEEAHKMAESKYNYAQALNRFKRERRE